MQCVGWKIVEENLDKTAMRIKINKNAHAVCFLCEIYNKSLSHIILFLHNVRVNLYLILSIYKVNVMNENRANPF